MMAARKPSKAPRVLAVQALLAVAQEAAAASAAWVRV